MVFNLWIGSVSIFGPCNYFVIFW